MRRLRPLIVPEASGRIVTVAELKRLGVKRWRLYAGDTTRPLRGVVADASIDPFSFESRIAATRAILRKGQFLSRRTAAQLLELPTMARVEAPSYPIEVGAIRPDKAPRRDEIAGHQIRPGTLRRDAIGPLWLPHPADVWGLLAGVSGLDELVMVGDHLISGRSRREPALCDPAELEETVRRFRRSVGIAKLREALPMLRTGVESPSESLLRLIIVRAGFEEPQTSCPVPVRGRRLYADLGYPRWRIAIEFDGEYHFEGGSRQARLDNSRIEAMIDAEWRVLRATSIDLRDPGPFLARLARAIAKAEAELRSV